SAGAERAARRWLRLQRSWPATQSLISVIEQQGRVAEAEALLKTNAPSDAPYEQIRARRLSARLRSHDFAAADEQLREDLRRAKPRNQVEGFGWLAISLREQGRLAAALDTARQLRRFPDNGRAQGPAQTSAVLEAQILLEAGQARKAAAVFDTVAHVV